MQMQFEQIYGDDLKKLAINIVKVMGKFDPKNLVIALAPDIKAELEHEEELKSLIRNAERKLNDPVFFI